MSLSHRFHLFLSSSHVVLALASVSSTMSVNVAGYLRRNYDGGASTASVAISDAEEPKQADIYEATSVFAEKKKEKDEADKAQKKLWRWTEIEACTECQKFKEEIMNATSELGKKKAKKYYEQAAAATLRAASHMSEKGEELWENFQEKYGADKANELADKWLAKHASSYDEKAFDDIDFAAKKGAKKVDETDPQIAVCYPTSLDETLN